MKLTQHDFDKAYEDTAASNALDKYMGSRGTITEVAIWKKAYKIGFIKGYLWGGLAASVAITFVFFRDMF